jgi:hypothetical protein
MSDCHSWVEVPGVSTASAEKNLFGFRARAFHHVSWASGRTVFSSCGADPSKAKKRLSSPMGTSIAEVWIVLIGGLRPAAASYGGVLPLPKLQ